MRSTPRLHETPLRAGLTSILYIEALAIAAGLARGAGSGRPEQWVGLLLHLPCVAKRGAGSAAAQAGWRHHKRRRHGMLLLLLLLLGRQCPRLEELRRAGRGTAAAVGAARASWPWQKGGRPLLRVHPGVRLRATAIKGSGCAAGETEA